MTLPVTLPPLAASIVRRFEREDEAVIAGNAQRSKQIVAVRERRDALLKHLYHLEAEDQRGRLVRAERDENNDTVIIHDTARLDAVRAEIGEENRRLAELQQPSQPRLSAQRIEQQLKRFRNAKFVDVARPSLPAGVAPAKCLADTRAEIEDLLARRTSLEMRSGTLAEAKAAMRNSVRDEMSVPKVHHDGTVIWPRIQGAPEKPDVFAILAFACAEQIVAKLDQILERNAEAYRDGISAKDRASEINSINAKLKKLEAIEAAAVEAIIAEGGNAYHLPRADVLTVLSIAVEK